MSGHLFPFARAGGVTATALALLIASCAQPNAPSEATFIRALEPLVADRFCRDLPGQLTTTTAYSPGETPPPLPLMVPAKPLPYPAAKGGDVAGRAMLAAATGEGLLTRTTTTAPARRWRGTEPLAPMALVV